jgi:hypothetical protein
MASKRRRESNPLSAPMNVAERALEQTSRITGEVVDRAASLTDTTRETAAEWVENVSPTAAGLLRPQRGGRKNRPSSAQRTVARGAKQARKLTSQATKAASRVAGQSAKAATRTAKASGKTSKAGAKGSKKGSAKRTTKKGGGKKRSSKK